MVSKAVALGAAALAAVFGVVFAHDSAAAAKPRSQPAPARLPVVTTTPAPSTTTTTTAPTTVLQPPAQPPAPAQGGDGAASSGGT